MPRRFDEHGYWPSVILGTLGIVAIAAWHHWLQVVDEARVDF